MQDRARRWPHSRTCAFASPPPRRRRRSPRPCRWSRRQSCAARRVRRKPRVLMPNAWARCWAPSRRRSPAAIPRRGCSPAPATTRCICWWSAPPSAACAAPFNSSIVRLAREQANALIAEGKEVKILCVGRKGYDQLRRLYEQADHRDDRTARRAHDRLRAGRYDRQEDHRAVRRRRVRCLHAVLLALQVGDRANPDRAADHPAGVRASPPRRAPPLPTNTSRKRKKSSPSCCRAICPCRCSARCWKTPPPSRARA